MSTVPAYLNLDGETREVGTASVDVSTGKCEVTVTDPEAQRFFQDSMRSSFSVEVFGSSCLIKEQEERD